MLGYTGGSRSISAIMPTITIREDGQTESGFTAILEFDHQARFPVTVRDPFGAGEEKRLEWYFEEWLQCPILDTVKAKEAADSVKAYGESLFEQVFRSNPDAYAEYVRYKGNLAQLRIEIEGNNPEFHALHWEALRDPNLPRPFAVEGVMVRKSFRSTATASEMAESATINLLLVVARPSKKDVNYRTISRPLVEGIENSRLPVNVELLRPATFEALSRHLEEKGAGYYHIVHFDTHGALLTYKEFNSTKPSEPNPLTYRERFGREQIQPYTGVKAFLVLEGEEEGTADLVEATEMADLLTGKGIPVCILNACQSGKQLRGDSGQGEEYRETSLGSRLMAAGMQMVVAMGYSVTVSAAEIIIEKLYKSLFSGKSIDEAIRLGRRELFNRKERRAYFNETIRLEDWLLPVVYSNRPVNFPLRELSAREEEAYFEAQAREFRFIQPEYQFVGRDLDILRVERALLRRNILLLQGMGGTGKTTLLNYLREWWQKTRFAERIFYFGYDESAWTLERILFALGTGIYDRFERGRFQAMNPVARMQKMVTLLRAENHVLILDNLESVTGEPLAIPNTLAPEEREKLRDFLSRLSGGKTRVVLGSRSGEGWLKDTTFQTNVYALRGLDQEARTELAKRILERHAGSQAESLQGEADFTRLMKVLVGYPLAMEVILPNLKRQSPGQVLEALQIADGDLDTDSEDKTKSIIKCVEYSHSNLSENSQKLLLCLAPFSGFIDRSDIPNYAQQLQKLEPLQGFDFTDFDTAIQEAIDRGLLKPIEEESPLLTIQPVFPYFLKIKLNALDPAMREAIQEGFKNHYQVLANAYNQLMESQDPQQRQLGIFFCRLEYENLYNALQTCLANRESIHIFFCLYKYFRLINDVQNNLKLSEFVCQSQESYFSEILVSEYGYQVTFALERMATNCLMTKQYDRAKQSYLKALEIYDVLGNIEERQKQLWKATDYHQLGRVAQELREFEEARENYRQALAIKVEFGDRYSQASTYHQLGI
ncbi:CHAT domain-containing protein, partial [Pannus brasiliensis CCIBt3594]